MGDYEKKIALLESELDGLRSKTLTRFENDLLFFLIKGRRTLRILVINKNSLSEHWWIER
jgi:hypothetical protein